MSKETMKIRHEDMVDFARGAAFLGTGGGGDPHIGRLFCENMIEKYGAPDILELEDVPDDFNLYTMAMMGAPTAIIEKLICGDDAELALETLEKHTGRKADAIIPVEIGGINSTLPIAIAAQRGLPIVNADGMGRAFPEIQMVSFNVYGVSISPLVITNEHMESVIIEAKDPKSAEDIGRSVAMQMGLSVMISAYPMTGAQAKHAAIPGTLKLALGIGQAIAEGRREGDPTETLLRYLKTTPYYQHCGILFEGKVVDLLRETTKGFAIGKCVLAPLSGNGSNLEVTFQNEFLVARQDGKVRAIVPDLICMVDTETAEPIPTEALKYGQRIRVIGTSVPPVMRTPEALEVFGPKGFGIDEPFQPIETLI